MSTKTGRREQQFIVHLDIQATALDPSDAIQEALEQVLRGGLRNITYRVEAVGGGANLTVPPTHQTPSTEAMDRVWGSAGERGHHRYPNEFLG